MFKIFTDPKVVAGIFGSLITYGYIRITQLQMANDKLLKEANTLAELAHLSQDAVLWMNGEFQNGTDLEEIFDGFNERSTFLEQVYYLNQ